jgi:DNA-binding Lrp family transcriptional regulator
MELGEMFQVDEKDMVIIAEMTRDPEVRLARIAAQVGLSQNGVQYRLTRLKDRGIVALRLEVDHEKLAMAQS